MIGTKQFSSRLAVVFVSVMVSGCVSLDAPQNPTRYYLLNGASDPATLVPKPNSSAPAVRVAPVELEPYLDTPYMVLRLQEYEVQFSDIHRWGEDLSSNIRRALARDLIATGAVSQVVVDVTGEWDYVVRLHVHRFEGVPPDMAHLSATWKLEDQNGQVLFETLFDDRSRGWQFENYGHLAEKLDESLDSLAKAMVARLQSL